jgi:citrate lyase subunit gamma (acyl carrier protein)
MEIRETAVAGSLESNDVLVIVSPSQTPGLAVTIDSIVIKQFGQQIEKTVREVASILGVSQGTIQLTDRGALDYALRARVETALRRASKESSGQDGAQTLTPKGQTAKEDEAKS